MTLQQKHISVQALQGMSMPIKEGNWNTEGYCSLAGTNISFQNVDANRAWNLILVLAKRLGVEALVRFKWRDKEKAAYPGKEGLLQWKP